VSALWDLIALPTLNLRAREASAALAAFVFQEGLLRHADAGDPMAWTGDDAERPLSKKGRRQSRDLSKLLKDLKLRPDAVITSPKIRAAQTAKLVAKPLRVKAMTDERLAGGFGPSELRDLAADLDPGIRRVILVGHDPDFSEALSWLVGAALSLPKGALARIDLPDGDIVPGGGDLRWLLPPDAIAG
jgi:phosphohistidine phosphatase